MELPFFGHKEPVNTLSPLDASKYPKEGVLIRGAEQAGDVSEAPAPVEAASPAAEAEQPIAPVVELPAPEAPAAEAPQEPADTDHQIPAQTA